MPCICLKEATSAEKHRLEDVEWSQPVSELKDRAFKVTNIPAIEQNLVYGGRLMKDNMALLTYGIKDGCTVFVMRKAPVKEPIEQDSEYVSLDTLMQVLEAAIKSPSYRATVEKILTNPEMMEQLIAATPRLAEDLTAMTLLQDPELLQQILESADIEQVVKQHPSLVEAASYIAVATANEGGEGGSGLQNMRSMVVGDNDDDEEMPDVEPGVLARAEMMAAQEESIQAASGMSQQVTPSMLASALASAGLPSTSGEGPSTSAASSQRVTRDMFTDAMATAMAGSSTGGSSDVTTLQTSSQLQTQLQQLRDMGITDDEVSLRALRATGGNVQAALEFIFGGT